MSVGYLAEWMDHLAEEKFLNANGISDEDLFDIEGSVSLQIIAMVRDGRTPNVQKIERIIAGGYLGDSNVFLLPFLVQFLNVNSGILGRMPGQP